VRVVVKVVCMLQSEARGSCQGSSLEARFKCLALQSNSIFTQLTRRSLEAVGFHEQEELLSTERGKTQARGRREEDGYMDY